MTRIYKLGRVEIWEVNERWGTDYWVYGYYASGDAKVCPSLDMARAVASCAS
jgi:hypothetical protein